MFGKILAVFELLSSPEQKASVRFSDQDLSVVCHRCCLNLFTFSSSSPLGRFQSNLAQSISARTGFKYVQMNDHILFKGDNFELLKMCCLFFKNLLAKNHLARKA